MLTLVIHNPLVTPLPAVPRMQRSPCSGRMNQSRWAGAPRSAMPPDQRRPRASGRAVPPRQPRQKAANCGVARLAPNCPPRPDCELPRPAPPAARRQFAPAARRAAPRPRPGRPAGRPWTLPSPPPLETRLTGECGGRYARRAEDRPVAIGTKVRSAGAGPQGSGPTADAGAGDGPTWSGHRTGVRPDGSEHVAWHGCTGGPRTVRLLLRPHRRPVRVRIEAR